MDKTNALSQTSRDRTQMHNLDIVKTGWIEQYGSDIILVHDPVFSFQHRHPYRMDMVMAILCDGGTASGSVNLEPYSLEKNGFLIVLPQHIAESYEVSEDFKGTYIFMSERFLSRLDIGDSYKFYESIENRPYIQLEESIFNALLHYVGMTRAMINASEQFPNVGEAIRLLTKAFFLMIGWSLHKDAVDKGTEPRDSATMHRFLSFVKNGYKEHRDVEYYAEKMNMTAKYMSTLIKKVSGKTALGWIEEYVILDAKAQLSSTMNTIQQICYDLNFPSQSFFGQYFKRIVGKSPSDYRRTYRANASTLAERPALTLTSAPSAAR